MTFTPEKRALETYPSFQSIDPAANVANKQRVVAIMQQIIDAPFEQLGDAIGAGYHSDASINVSHPVNELGSPEAFGTQFWMPLREALPDVERRVDIVAGGSYDGEQWVGCFGHYVGTFASDWLGIPATQGVVAVRYNEGHRLRDGKIAESYVFIDFLDLMRQAGYWPLAPSLGRELLWLPPMTRDGVLLAPQDADLSERTFNQIMDMWHGIDINTDELLSPELMDRIDAEDARHFHPNFMWYGAAGIGTARGIKGYHAYHGYPFVSAFPDVGGRDKRHFMLIADGMYAVTGGWGYLQATHAGNDFLGMPATGKHVAMRVMDFYRCDGESICENWVPIDIPHLLLQLGVDVFGRMRMQFRQNDKLAVRSWLMR